MIPNQFDALQESYIPVFVTQETQQKAQNFAKQQPTQEKAKQVYLNTLAVCVVRNYLQVLGIQTDWSSCDSYHPMIQMMTNTADLTIVGHGRVECRPVSTAELYATPSTCYVPTDVHDERIGYVIVHIEDGDDYEQKSSEARLLGFTSAVDAEILPLNQLRPFDEFLYYLHQNEYQSDNDTQKVLPQSFYDAVQEPANQALTILNQWFQDITFREWQRLDTLIESHSMVVQYRKRNVTAPQIEHTDTFLSRGKVLPFLTNDNVDGESSVVLIVELMALEGSAFDITLRVQPLSIQEQLPSGLWLGLVDELGTILMDATNMTDDYQGVELRFCADRGDRFDLRIQRGETLIIEKFVV